MVQNLDFLRFDFEKQYLIDVHAWSQLLLDPKFLMNQFKNTKYDGALGFSVGNGLTKLYFLTSMVKNGYLCGHRTLFPRNAVYNIEHYLPWQRNEDGRLWSACKLKVFDYYEERPMKLKKLLTTEIETLEQLLKYRKVVLGALTDHGYQFTRQDRKNMFKDGLRLDEKVREYQNILKTEMALRQKIITTLALRQKGLGTKHKTLLKTLTKLLQKVSLKMCYEKAERKMCKQELDYNNNALIKKCARCQQNSLSKMTQIDLITF